MRYNVNLFLKSGMAAGMAAGLSGREIDAVFVVYVFPGITYIWIFSIFWFI